MNLHHASKEEVIDAVLIDLNKHRLRLKGKAVYMTEEAMEKSESILFDFRYFNAFDTHTIDEKMHKLKIFLRKAADGLCYGHWYVQKRLLAEEKKIRRQTSSWGRKDTTLYLTSVTLLVIKAQEGGEGREWAPCVDMLDPNDVPGFIEHYPIFRTMKVPKGADSSYRIEEWLRLVRCHNYLKAALSIVNPNGKTGEIMKIALHLEQIMNQHTDSFYCSGGGESEATIRRKHIFDSLTGYVLHGQMGEKGDKKRKREFLSSNTTSRSHSGVGGSSSISSIGSGGSGGSNRTVSSGNTALPVHPFVDAAGIDIGRGLRYYPYIVEEKEALPVIHSSTGNGSESLDVDEDVALSRGSSIHPPPTTASAESSSSVPGECVDAASCLLMLAESTIKQAPISTTISGSSTGSSV